jgi:hypothetical protein
MYTAVAPEAETEGVVANWFTMPEMKDVEIVEIVIYDDVYSTRLSPGELMTNAETRKVIGPSDATSKNFYKKIYLKKGCFLETAFLLVEKQIR